MKPRSSLANPSGIRFSRDMPEEVFGLLKLTVLKGNNGKVAKTTSCVETLQITTLASLREWIMHVGSKKQIQKSKWQVFSTNVLKTDHTVKL